MFDDNGSTVYTGGHMYVGDSGGWHAHNLNNNPDDMRFRVSLSSTAVPIPSSMVLLGLGLAGLVGVRRKTKNRDAS